jgi:hypothetical protein
MANGTASIEGALQYVVQQFTNTGGGVQWSFCNRLNETYCPAIVEGLMSGSVPIFLFNSLGWTRTEVVTLPAQLGTTVRGPNGTMVSQLSTDPVTGLVSISFVATVPALGSLVVQLVPGNKHARVPQTLHMDNFIANSNYNLTFAGPGGALSHVNGVAITMNYLWYNASAGNNADGQASGAYIFRPNTSNPFYVTPQGTDLRLVIEKGPIFQSARLYYSNWIEW